MILSPHIDRPEMSTRAANGLNIRSFALLTRGGVGDEGEVVGALVVVADFLVAGVDQLLHHRQRHPVPSVRAEGDRALAQDCR